MGDKKIALRSVGQLHNALRNLIKKDSEDGIDRANCTIREFWQKKAKLEQRYSKLKSDMVQRKDPNVDSTEVEDDFRKAGKKSRFFKAVDVTKKIEKTINEATEDELQTQFASSPNKFGWRTRFREWIDEGALPEVIVKQDFSFKLPSTSSRLHSKTGITIEPKRHEICQATIRKSPTFSRRFLTHRQQANHVDVVETFECTAEPHELSTATSVQRNFFKKTGIKSVLKINKDSAKSPTSHPLKKSFNFPKRVQRRRVTEKYWEFLKKKPFEKIQKNFYLKNINRKDTEVVLPDQEVTSVFKFIRRPLVRRLSYRERSITVTEVLRKPPSRNIFGAMVTIPEWPTVRARVRKKLREQPNKKYKQHVSGNFRMRRRRFLAYKTASVILPAVGYDRAYYDTRKPRKIGLRVRFKFPDEFDQTFRVFQKAANEREGVCFTIKSTKMKVSKTFVCNDADDDADCSDE